MHTLFHRLKTPLYKRIIAFFVIGGLVSQPAAMLADEVTLAPHRGVPYATLATFFPTPLKLKESSQNAETSPDDALHKKLSEDFSLLSLYEKRKMAFELLSASEKPLEIDPTITNLLQELEIFTNRNNPEAPSVFSALNRTNTVFGEVTLAHLLANPSDDIKELTKRQAIIHELVENETLFQSLNNALEDVKHAEDGFLAFAYEILKEQALRKQEEKEDEEFFSFIPTTIKNGLTSLAKPIGHAVKAASTSPTIMDIYKRVGDFWLPATVVYATYLGRNLNGRLRDTQDLLGIAPATIITPKISNIKLETVFRWREYNPFCYKTLYHEIIEKRIKEKGCTQDQATTEAFKDIILLGFTNAATVISNGYQVYSFIKTIKEDNKSMILLHKKLNKTATIINASKTLGATIEQNQALKDGFASQDILTDMFSAQGNQNLNRLLGYLQTKTFKDEPSYFSYAGRVLASKNLAEDHIPTMISVMKALGEIDAYMAIAKLYKEGRQSDVHYCFVTYQQSATPALSLQRFWHPLLAKETVVTNDLILNEGSRGIILTGSNTGGKSTLLKSVLLNSVLAQTFTIAPAAAAIITPFALLGSYLSVSDDIATGNSLFRAEVLRAKNLLQKSGTLQPGQSAFVVIDELFTGTAADKGSAAACKVAEALANKNNVMYILATHFPELTLLEKSTNGRCKNYQIDVLRHDDGTITRPFKMKPGVSKTSIANDLLQEELVDIVF